jgi:hypothetical protein
LSLHELCCQAERLPRHRPCHFAQCYDRYLMSSLQACAEQVQQPSWGLGGPHDAGGYKLWPHQSPFFAQHGSWGTPYGSFFLQVRLIVADYCAALRQSRQRLHAPCKPAPGSSSPSTAAGASLLRLVSTSACRVRPMSCTTKLQRAVVLRCVGATCWAADAGSQRHI